MQDRKTVHKKLLALAECFDKTLSEALQLFYLEALQPYDDEKISMALSRCFKELKFFPRPAEIIEMITGPKQTDTDKAVEAWDTLLKAIAHKGSYRSIVFADAPIMSVVRAMGGWENVCMWTEAELEWRFKEFEKLYHGLKNSEPPEFLAGRQAQQAIQSGGAVKAPVFVGDGVKRIENKTATDKDLLKKISGLAVNL